MYRFLTHLIVLIAAMLVVHRAEARDYSALVVEPESGRVLYEKFANELRHPASVTKMMTLYLVFEALERGDITLNTPFDVSRNAVLRPPSRLGLTPGDTLSVEDAILGLVTRSANDVATVIAENLGGSETVFAEMMTARAHRLGMRDTVFRNASGLPDPQQVTTAWDMFKLGRALLQDFPRYYPYFSTPRFYYRGQSFDNHNHLMETYPGMDGIKTGFINSSGFNLVASAKRNGRRLIGVVFGGPSASRRDSHMREILDDGFAQLEGAPAGYIVAEFEKPPEPRARRRLEQFELDPPQVTFGSANRFKTTRPGPEVVRLGNVYRAPRETRAAMRPEPRPVVSKPRATPALSSSPAASRRAADAVRAAATRSTAKPVSHRVDKAPAKAAPVKSAYQSPTAKKSSSRDKPVPASPRCKPGKCRG